MTGGKTKVIAVVPAFNEENRIEGVLKELGKYVDEIVVSDDGSSDRTLEIARENGAWVVSSPKNIGVGHATRLGCEYAIKQLGAGVIVLLDADGQHPPSRIPELLGALGNGCEFVFTNRLSDSAKMPAVKRLGNWGLSLATNLLAGTNVKDTQCGFRAFRADVYEKLGMKSDGYEICSEFVLNVGRKRIRHCEIPISAEYDEWTRAKGTGIRTGVVIFLRLLRLAFS